MFTVSRCPASGGDHAALHASLRFRTIDFGAMRRPRGWAGSSSPRATSANAARTSSTVTEISGWPLTHQRCVASESADRVRELSTRTVRASLHRRRSACSISFLHPHHARHHRVACRGVACQNVHYLGFARLRYALSGKCQNQPVQQLRGCEGTRTRVNRFGESDREVRDRLGHEVAFRFEVAEKRPARYLGSVGNLIDCRFIEAF